MAEYLRKHRYMNMELVLGAPTQRLPKYKCKSHHAGGINLIQKSTRDIILNIFLRKVFLFPKG